MTRQGVIVLGSINVDLVVRGSRLPRPGETVVGGTFFQASGGKGANQAVAAARLSRQRVPLVAAVGGDALGRWSLERLGQENLELSLVRTVADRPTGVALILVDAAGENLISVASGANHALGVDDLNRVPAEVWRQSAVFVAGLEVPLESVRQGLRLAKQAGLTTILNPAPADPRAADSEILALVDVLTPNEGEAAALSGLPVVDRASAVAAAAALHERGCGHCLVTLGADGAVLVGGERSFIPARPVQAVDTTAAGDAFTGALAVALAEGRTIAEAAQWATRAASIAVTRAGAQPSLPRRDEVEALSGAAGR